VKYSGPVIVTVDLLGSGLLGEPDRAPN
jgi:hypothetical protein